MTKSWTYALVVALLIASSSALPVPEDATPSASTSSEVKTPEVYDDYADEAETKVTDTRSIASGESKIQQDPSVMITRALEDVSNTLGTGIKNLGHSAIQILEGTGVAAEQALGSGARIVTGVAETAAEAAETGAKSAIRIAHGVANSLTQGTKSLVETKTNLLKGLTGANPSSSLQADASSNNEAVQRNERAGPTGYGGYSTSPSYGPNTAAETPNNFVNVFSQAAANTVNFGTQLLNSLVGVAANLLQGTVSTLLSLLNAKGQVVGAVVQSAPPVLASVTRTAGDVLAAKARIFGAVTQGFVKMILEILGNLNSTGAMVASSAAETGGRVLTAGGKAFRISVGATSRGFQSVYEAASSFGRQLGTVFGDSFSGLFARMNAAAASADGESGSSTGAGQFSAGGALRNVLTALTRLGGGAGGTGRETSSESGSSNVALGGLGNFATSLINAKLNLLNGLLSPFTGGRPILNFGSRGSQAASSNSDYSPVASEPNFRISIAGTASPSSAASSSDSQTSNGPRAPRFYANPDLPQAPKIDAQLTPANLVATFNSGVIKGIVDQFNTDLRSRFASTTTTVKPKSIFAGFGSTAYPKSHILPSNPDTNEVSSSEERRNPFSRILPLAFARNSAEKKKE